MDYITVNEASSMWNISQRRVTTLCKEGRIQGAEKMGLIWVIPKNAQKPPDVRIKTGRYVGTRKQSRASNNCSINEQNEKYQGGED